MEQKTLTVSARTQFKKGGARKLRSAGKIPAIVYGAVEPYPITVDQHEFMTKFRNVKENTIIGLVENGKTRSVLVKDYQDNILTGKVEHIDFFEVTAGHVLRTRIPVKIIGSSRGVREGGLQEIFVHDLEVECMPKDLPNEFTVDISALGIGDSIHVTDLEIPEGVKVIAAEDQVIVVVAHPKEEASESDEVEEEEAVEEETKA